MLEEQSRPYDSKKIVGYPMLKKVMYLVKLKKKKVIKLLLSLQR
jgi:hypothetical protein